MERRGSHADEGAPFSLPLDREDFADALAKGMGRVFLHVERCGSTGLVDLIVEASLEDGSWDRPGVPPRGAWLRNLAFAAGCADEVEEALCAVVLAEDEDSDLVDSQHRRDVLRHFARSGSETALRTIEEGLRLDRESGAVLGDIELVNLAGAKALISVSEYLAQELRPDDEWTPDDHLREFDLLIEQQGAARRVLEEAAIRSALVVDYLAMLDAKGPETFGESLEDPAGFEAANRGSSERIAAGVPESLELGEFLVPEDPNEAHEVIQDMLEKLERNPDGRARELLETAYDRTPCVHCRSLAADILGRLTLVPDWMVEELVFDLRQHEED